MVLAVGAGGGGGAGSPGSDGVVADGGNGGDGISNSINVVQQRFEPVAAEEAGSGVFGPWWLVLAVAVMPLVLVLLG